MMKRTLLVTAASAALIAAAGLATAQESQMPRTGGSAPPPAAQQSAPAEKSAPPMQRNQGAQMPSTQGAGSAADGKVESKPSAAQERPADRARGAQDNTRDDKSGTVNRNAQSPSQKNDSKASSDTKSGAGTASETNTQQRNTTGQGAAATAGSVNLTTEQRTRISTTIKQQNVRPITNVNFSVSIGTRVPRTVRFHTLPTTVIEVYPEWRGYSYILVDDEIVIIDPRTYEIVYVIPA